MMPIIKTIGIIALLILIFVVGNLFVIVLAVKDMRTNFVKLQNITTVDCDKLTEEIVELDYTCGKYFSNNRQFYCKQNITNYYLQECER